MIDLDLPGELAVCILLLSLPATYGMVVTALETQAVVPDLDFVNTTLINEERKRGAGPYEGASLCIGRHAEEAWW